MQIKNALLSRGLYAFDRFMRMDVYKAVLDDRIHCAEDFLRFYAKTVTNGTRRL